MSHAFGYRRSIRLPNFDYTQSGAYFITVCTKNRQRFFGSVEHGVMHPSDCGHKVNQVWYDLPSRFPWITIDAFQIMPDHIHGIIWIHRPVDGMAPTHVIRRGESHSPLRGESHSPLNVNANPEPPSSENVDNNADTVASPKNDDERDPKRGEWDSKIGEQNIERGEWDSPLQCGTSKTVGSVVRGLKIPVTQWARQSMGIHDVWQRNYFERIIRSQQALESIRRYIVNNPAHWRAD